MEPTCETLRLDGDCDVAALVYGMGERPDEVLLRFASDLIAAGRDVVGSVQARRLGAAELVLIPNRSRDIAPGRRGAAAGAPVSDTMPLAARWLRRRIRRKPELLVINRFGSLERAGGGFCSVIQAALDNDVPVVLAVPAALFEGWLKASHGMMVRLTCERASLDAWWTALDRGTRADVATLCARTK